MRSLLNNSEERRLKLVEILYFFSNFAKKDNVLKELDCKENTLRSDIDFINEKYNKILKITLSSNYIKLEFMENQSISKFYGDLLDSLIVFKMIENIFLSNFSSVEELSTNLYTSSSTVYRLIDKFNQAASKTYKISVDTRSLYFTGDELDIRNFFIQFFTEKYTANKWPFININKEDLQTLISEFIKLFDYKIPYSDFENITLICAVNLSSYLDGFVIDVKNFNDLSKKIYHENFVENKPPIKIKNTMRKLGINISIESIYNIFHNFIHDDYAYNFEYFLNISMNSNKCSSLRNSINNLFGLIYRLRKKFEIHVTNVDELAVRLNNSALLFNSIPQSNYILFDVNSFYIRKMKINYKNIVESVSSELEQYLLFTDGKVIPEKLNYLTYILLSTWVDLVPTVFQRKKKVKVIVSSISNYFHSNNMKEYLEIILPNFVEVDLYEDQVFDINKLDNEIYDFVITDFTIKLENGPTWIYFFGNQSYEDIMRISEIIYKKFFEKNNEV